MRINSVTLKNIKSYGRIPTTIKFDDSKSIYTVSGKNGSGKTTVFKAIQLFQKLYFIDLIGKENIDPTVLESIEDEITGLCSSPNGGEIKLEFLIDSELVGSRLCLRKKDEICWEFHADQDFYEQVSQYWNAENPRDLFIFMVLRRFL